jgi:hypothetical protein
MRITDLRIEIKRKILSHSGWDDIEDFLSRKIPISCATNYPTERLN